MGDNLDHIRLPCLRAHNQFIAAGRSNQFQIPWGCARRSAHSDLRKLHLCHRTKRHLDFQPQVVSVQYLPFRLAHSEPFKAGRSLQILKPQPGLRHAAQQ